MPQIRTSIVEFLRSALHARYDAILNDPLPERWVDLINHLNEQEREQLRQRRGSETAGAGGRRPM